jgi:hypothetical protein
VEADKEIMALMTAYGCSEERAREFKVQADGFRHAMRDMGDAPEKPEVIGAALREIEISSKVLDMGDATDSIYSTFAASLAQSLYEPARERLNAMHPTLSAPYGGYTPTDAPVEEVTSVAKVAALVEFAGTKDGRAAIEEELKRRASEDNPKIRSADTPGQSRAQRREMQRRMDKAIQRAKAAGVKR